MSKGSDKNVANIEEDVKILEEFAEICKAGLACYDQTREGKALEHILAEREQMLKEKQDDKKDIKDFQNALNEENLRCANYAIENNELKKRIQELEKALLKVKDKNTTLFITCRNSIPMQVVIDKMEELNKEIKSCDEIDAIFKIKQQQILQELLEGGNKDE